MRFAHSNSTNRVSHRDAAEHLSMSEVNTLIVDLTGNAFQGDTLAVRSMRHFHLLRKEEIREVLKSSLHNVVAIVGTLSVKNIDDRHDGKAN